ncbi:efflux RND transporter permease subunit [Alteromonas sp. ASW11-130]|uniref:efflux RND transporter permease subunit n=1 Tax=Alteromonas sp. ASW11-130 TaxID=3015775 RepID=UPI002241C2DD|nr:MMPL family transporter [Alteromonas sp. ASW11-130]MCW8091248.1 MMPL family transporter [Alteromonas sp. ASW11-130]
MRALPGWIAWFIKSPKIGLVLFVVVCVIASIGAKNLYFRGDYKVFFEEDNPQRVAFEEMQNIFNKSENVSFIIVPQSGSIYQPSTFELIQSLTEDAWQLPLSLRVESLSNYQHTFAEQDDMIVTDLIRSGQTDVDHIKWVEGVVASSPEISGRLVSDKAEVAVIDVTVQLPDGDQTKEVIEIADFARQLEQKYEKAFPGHQIYLTGMVIMNDAFSIAAQQDAQTLVPFMFLLITVLIGLLTRSVYAAISTLIIVIASIMITMGLAGWYGMFLSTATVNMPTVITTLAVADCIHVIVAMRQFLNAGMSKADAIHKSILINKKPILITSVTTAIGFLMLNFSAVPILADLGNTVAVGVMLACLFSLTVLPSLLTLFPFKPSSGEAAQAKYFTKAGHWVTGNYKLVLPVSAVILLTLSFLSVKNELNDVAVNYFDDSSTFRQAVNIQEDYLGGMSNIDFVAYTDEQYGITEPTFLHKIEQFANWLEEQPEVHHVLSFSDTMKRLNMNMHEDQPDFYAIPENRELASQYLLLYEMSLPYGLDLNNQIDIDKSALRVIAVLDNLGSKEFTDFERRAKAWFNKLAPDLRLEAASPPLMFAHIGERNMESMVGGTLIALVLISGLIVIALRSWFLGGISLITNLVPAGVGFGIWGVVSGEINMALSVVLSMTLGIIVDDTVHFLSKYQVARDEGRDVKEAVHYAFNTVGQAMTTTTIVLAAGFGVLTLSSFALNADMGALTVIIIISALLIDLLFLPAFLVWLNRRKEAEYDQTSEQT